MIKFRIEYSSGSFRDDGLWEARLEIVQPDLCVLREVNIDKTGAPMNDRYGAPVPESRRYLQHVRHEVTADGFTIHGDAVKPDAGLIGPIKVTVNRELVTLHTGSSAMPTISRKWFAADGVTPNDVALQQLQAEVRAWKVEEAAA